MITTVAGNGNTTPDGGPATKAPLSAPQAVVTDQSGNMYIGGYGGIRKVDRAGIITWFVRLPDQSNPPDKSNPGEIVMDNAGNLYIADTGNHQIRKVNAQGSMTTIAGTGENGYSGDGGPATQSKPVSWWTRPGMSTSRTARARGCGR